MRTTELSMIMAVMLGCMFKFLYWPGASVLVVLGGCGLALFYFPFGFRTLPAPKPTDQILWMSVLGGFAISISMVALVFFLMRWPLQSELLVMGTVLCLIALLVGGVLRYKHPRLDIYLDGLLIRCLVLAALTFAMWYLFSEKPR
ncbi:MAG: hypothetical protein IPJ85_12460 [Flavobacteriales bacterium]|nr:hypothetical protein [Flavobacteriales bacterium]